MSWPANAGHPGDTYKMRPLVIIGSARPDGDTRRAVNIAFQNNADIIILPQHQIGGYDYAHRNADDDFRPIVAAMRDADAIVFATPVYWYAMSAPLKFFFDRLTDLLETMKAEGRALAGKRVWLIASGAEEELPEGFEVPFRRTAEYLAMGYRDMAYLYTGDDQSLRNASESALAEFGGAILAD